MEAQVPQTYSRQASLCLRLTTCTITKAKVPKILLLSPTHSQVATLSDKVNPPLTQFLHKVVLLSLSPIHSRLRLLPRFQQWAKHLLTHLEAAQCGLSIQTSQHPNGANNGEITMPKKLMKKRRRMRMTREEKMTIQSCHLKSRSKSNLTHQATKICLAKSSTSRPSRELVVSLAKILRALISASKR